jgi:FkbM family methyltransferase
MKRLLQQILYKWGYRIEKIREEVSCPIDIFDLVVRDWMAKNGPSLSFVQIGANDGKSHDPLRRYVEEFGWSGVLVEPIPALFAELKENYRGQPQLRFENAAIAREDGEATIYAVRRNSSFPDWANELASFNKQVLLSHAPLVPGLESHVEAVTVPAMRITTLLKKHGIAGIDILQIDTEGFDYEILKMFDFSAVRPKIIQFEHKHLTRDERPQCLKLLVSQGYRFAQLEHDTVAYIGEAAGADVGHHRAASEVSH